MIDALLALALWSSVGLGLMWGASQAIEQQGQTWRMSQAIEWQADLIERLRLARVQNPVQLSWEQKLSASACDTSACDANAWRDSLIADWQTRLKREQPQMQSWLDPWSVDARLQAVVLRWPQKNQPQRTLPLNNLACPADWQCLAFLGWP